MRQKKLKKLALLGLVGGLILSGQSVAEDFFTSHKIQIARGGCRDRCGSQASTLLADNSDPTTSKEDNVKKSCSGKSGCTGQKTPQSQDPMPPIEKKINTKNPKDIT